MIRARSMKSAQQPLPACLPARTRRSSSSRPLIVAITPATVSFPVEVDRGHRPRCRAHGDPRPQRFRIPRCLRAPGTAEALDARVDPLQPGKRLEATGPQEVRELVDVFNDMLDRLEGERRESGRQALAAQEGERWRVAQELHDDVGQALTGILLRLEALARQAPTDLDPTCVQPGEATRETRPRHQPRSRGSFARKHSSDLEGSPRRSPPSRGGSRRSPACGSDIASQPASTSSTTSPNCVIYRVAQESLTNAARHTRARWSWTRLAKRTPQHRARASATTGRPPRPYHRRVTESSACASASDADRATLDDRKSRRGRRRGQADRAARAMNNAQFDPILLADDHHVVRHGLRLLIDARARPHRCRRAGDGIEAVQPVLETTSISRSSMSPCRA